MWSWDPTAETWSAVCGTTTPATPACDPGGRDSAGLAYDAAHQKLTLFGGGNGGGFSGTYFGDTWVYDGSAWFNVSPASGPTPRQLAALVADTQAGNLVLFGGFGCAGQCNGADASDTWTWVGTSGPACKTGDVNCNGTVDATDALRVLRLVASLPSTGACPVPAPNPAKIATDGNPNLDATDALCILRGVAHLPMTNACPQISAP
jgi:hypothetical protein